MEPDEYVKLECTIAAILAAGSVGHIVGGTTSTSMWMRYTEMLVMIRKNNGLIQPDNKFKYDPTQ